MVLWVEKFSNTQFLEKFGHSFRSTLTFCVRAGMVFVKKFLTPNFWKNLAIASAVP